MKEWVIGGKKLVNEDWTNEFVIQKNALVKFKHMIDSVNHEILKESVRDLRIQQQRFKEWLVIIRVNQWRCE